MPAHAQRARGIHLLFSMADFIKCVVSYLLFSFDFLLFAFAKSIPAFRGVQHNSTEVAVGRVLGEHNRITKAIREISTFRNVWYELI